MIGTFDNLLEDLLTKNTNSMKKIIKGLLLLREDTSDIIKEKVEVTLIKYIKSVDLTKVILNVIELIYKHKPYSLDSARLL